MKGKTIITLMLLFTSLRLTFSVYTRIVNQATPESCGRRSVLTQRACQEIEEQALRTTVRIVLQSWIVNADESGYEIDRAAGHATVMAGRYLVTHNHFNPSFNIPVRDGSEAAYVVIFIYDSQGELLHEGNMSDFELVSEASETLVFAHKRADFFTTLGFASAEFRSWPDMSLTAGNEVAQVNWDGERAYIEWTTIKEVIIHQGTPRLVLANVVQPGASGGGIFWQGVHIANNWRIEEAVAADGLVIAGVTTVALNSSDIITAAPINGNS